MVEVLRARGIRRHVYEEETRTRGPQRGTRMHVLERMR